MSLFERFFKPRDPETPEQAERAIGEILGEEFETGVNFLSVGAAYKRAMETNATFPENIRLTRNHILNMLRDEALAGIALGGEFTAKTVMDEIEKIRKEGDGKPQ